MRAQHIIKAALVALTTGIVPAASAADFGLGPLRGTQYASPMAETHVWEGGYFGGFGGMSNGSASFKNTLQREIAFAWRDSVAETVYGVSRWPVLPNATGRQNNFGVFAGWNYQFDEIVLGVEADYTRLNLRSAAQNSLTRTVTLAPLGFAGNGVFTVTGRGSIDLRNVTTLRARAGYTIGSFMPFVTAGVALADYQVARSASLVVTDVNGNAILTQPLVSSKKTRFGAGLAAGAGVDVAVSENFFLRGEWQFLHFPSLDGVVVDVNTVRAAAGVKF